MTAYRRLRLGGACYFFTVALADRRASLLVDRVDLLRRAVGVTMAEREFRCDAAVVLPDHLHMIWTLPEGDADFSTRWRLIKARFSRASGVYTPRGRSQWQKRERGVWQRRFWEHLIRDEQDYQRHLAYCWWNPVKHGLVQHPADWPYSSIHRDRRLGLVPTEWQETAEGSYGEP